MAAPKILCDTAGMSNARWLECRMHGPRGDIPYTLGGSDIATIFGVSPWTTPKELWRVKKGLMKPLPKDNGLQLELGHLLEPVAAKLYELKTQNTVEVDTHLYHMQTIRMHLRILIDALFARKMANAVYWNARARLTTKQTLGKTVVVRCTTSCNCDSI